MTTQTRPTRTQKGGLAEFRIIPRIEAVPWVVAFSQTWLGKIMILAAFGCGIIVFVRDLRLWLVLIGTIMLATFFTERRRVFLAIAPILLVLLQHFREPMLLGLNLVVIASGVLLYLGARRWPKSRFGQRPLVFLLGGFVLLILLACVAPSYSSTSAILWNLVAVFASYVWFIGYALMDRNSEPDRHLTLEIATFRRCGDVRCGDPHTLHFPKALHIFDALRRRIPNNLPLCN